MSEKNELLPCPFCGGPVELERAADTRSDIYGVRKWWGVKCRNTINLGGTCAVEAIPSASPEAAISRWNRRACPPASVRGVEMGDEEILHLWDTHVGYETQAPSSRKMPLGREDKLVFARAILSAASAPKEELPTPSQLRAMARPAHEPAPCMPGRHCERQERRLGACIAGTCNPPKPADGDGVMASHPLQTPCKHCGAKQGEEHSVTCPHGVPAAPVPKHPDDRLADAPLGTVAPSINGGGWLKTEGGWVWNGHTNNPGDTWNRPSGAWTGELRTSGVQAHPMPLGCERNGGAAKDCPSYPRCGCSDGVEGRKKG
jgi:hypothetical protein